MPLTHRGPKKHYKNVQCVFIPYRSDLSAHTSVLSSEFNKIDRAIDYVTSLHPHPLNEEGYSTSVKQEVATEGMGPWRSRPGGELNPALTATEN